MNSTNKKKLIIAVLLIVVVALAIGIYIATSQNGEHKITVTRSSDGKVVTFDKVEDISKVEAYLKAGFKQSGIADMVSPAPYLIKIDYKKKKSEEIKLYLYEEDDKSVYAYSHDDATTYQVSNKQVAELKALFAEKFATVSK